MDKLWSGGAREFPNWPVKTRQVTCGTGCQKSNETVRSFHPDSTASNPNSSFMTSETAALCSLLLQQQLVIPREHQAIDLTFVLNQHLLSSLKQR